MGVLTYIIMVLFPTVADLSALRRKVGHRGCADASFRAVVPFETRLSRG